jgi:acetoin utilization deacetylase AcuC-like enzyme
MKIVFDQRYREVYAADPAAAQGRLDRAQELLCSRYDCVSPDPALEADLQLVHPARHINRIKEREHLYELAVLAAGGAIKAAELACAGEPAFGLIRPPGHHASIDSCWGFCWFNNIAIAMEKMRREKGVEQGVIVDIDLHFGDGTSGFYAAKEAVSYFHLDGPGSLEAFLNPVHGCDLVGISAGFDRHVEDWGGMLSTEDYRSIGKTIREFSQVHCPGRVFAVLEGGYNHHVLGEAILALLEGLEP